MSIGLIVGTDVIRHDDRVCILNTSLDKLILDIVFVEESGNTRITVGSLHENVTEGILKTKFCQKSLNVKHDQSELLVSIYDLEITFGITKVVDLSISISIETEALLVGMLLFNPASWQSLFLLNVFCTTTSVKILWCLILVDQCNIQSLCESGKTNEIIDGI